MDATLQSKPGRLHSVLVILAACRSTILPVLLPPPLPVLLLLLLLLLLHYYYYYCYYYYYYYYYYSCCCCYYYYYYYLPDAVVTSIGHVYTVWCSCICLFTIVVTTFVETVTEFVSDSFLFGFPDQCSASPAGPAVACLAWLQQERWWGERGGLSPHPSAHLQLNGLARCGIGKKANSNTLLLKPLLLLLASHHFRKF